MDEIRVAGEVSIRNLIKNALDFVRIGISNNMNTYNRNASRNTLRSLRTIVESDQYGYLEGLSSLAFMERGRGRGKLPYNYQEIFKRWVIDKGIALKTNTNNGYNPSSWDKAAGRVARAIAFSIMKNGTTLHRTNTFEDIYSSNINLAIDKLGKQLIWCADMEFTKIATGKKK